jgi:hypothetical protein
MNNRCPICDDSYNKNDREITYHVTYKPEITTNACYGCNYAEFLIRHPEKEKEIDPSKIYHMQNRIKKVKEWTLKNKPLIT